MAQGGGRADDPDRGADLPDLRGPLQAARVLTPGLEVQQLKASVRARLFGIVDAPPRLGDYALLRLIGRGGMGAVYAAAGPHGEVVALKTLRGFDPAALYRLKQEFRALTDLVHPNLVLLHRLVIAGDQVYLTMELIDGVDFLVDARRPAAGARLRETLPQLVAGISALHAAGKLHRDIKPSNVLVDAGGRVVVLDFGLVQELVDTRSSGEVLVGTPAYMAPELLLGAAATPASDWYSVGVMVYEALTGALPFAGGGFEVLRSKCARDPEPPQARAPGVDPALAELCLRLLARDPAARPDGPGILRALGGPAAAAPPAGRGRAALIGRDRELALLRRAHAEARLGRPAVLLVRGGSGVGKTTLIQAFLDELAGAAVVLCGRCYEREQVPHNAFDSLVDALTGWLLALPPDDQSAALAGAAAELAALARLFPVLRRLPAVAAACAEADPEDMSSGTAWRDRAYAGLRGILGWLSGRSPVVLHIDDLQWTDADSATLLAELAAAPAPRCLLIASLRVGEAGPAPVVLGLLRRLGAGDPRPRELAGEATGAAAVRELAVEPLTRGDTVRLARALLAPGGDALADACAAAIARESAGLPLFVHELAHAVLSSVSQGTGVSAARLEDIIAARAERLPEPDRGLLEAVAVAGRPLAALLVAGLAGGGGGRAALQRLQRERLVRTTRGERGEFVEVYHDRIRETVLAGMSAGRLRGCHRRLAEALLAGAEDGGEPEVLAHHLRAAGETERARQSMVAAAQRASQTLAFHRAAELLLAAVELSPTTDADGRRALRAEAGGALASAGRYGEAADCFLQAAASAPPRQAVLLRRRAAEALMHCGAVERGRSQLESVLAELGCPMPRTGVARAARALAQEARLRSRGLGFVARRESEIDEVALLRLDTLRMARLAVVSFDPRMGRLYQVEHLLQCLEVGEPGRIVRALVGHAAYLAHDGQRRVPEAERLLTHARALIARHRVEEALPYACLCAGVVAFHRGEWREAQSLFDAAGLPPERAPAGQAPLENSAAAQALLVGLCGQWSLASLFWLGDLAALTLRREVFLARVRAVGDRASEGRVCASMSVFVALAADDPEAAERELTATLRTWPRGTLVLERGYAFLAARAIDLYVGDPARAWARLDEAWPEFARSYIYGGQYGRVAGSFWRGAAALLAARADRPPRRIAATLAAAIREIDGQRVRWGAALAQVLRAGQAALAGRADRAQAALAVAIAGFDALEMQLWAAACRWQLARLAGDAAREAAALARLQAMGVRAPARMAASLVPVHLA
jgi:tetratricopeptide (TPR) repeat protein